jgi:hypothetical protein
MLTNVGRVRVNENIKERRENSCSFMLFDRILCFLLEHQRKSSKIVFMFPEISLEFSFCWQTTYGMDLLKYPIISMDRFECLEDLYRHTVLHQFIIKKIQYHSVSFQIPHDIQKIPLITHSPTHKKRKIIKL